jgi:hypothetical protein
MGYGIGVDEYNLFIPYPRSFMPSISQPFLRGISEQALPWRYTYMASEALSNNSRSSTI